MASRFSLRNAALVGAAVGAAVPLLGAVQGEFAGLGIGGIALAMLGAAAGGAVLFVIISLAGNLLLR